MEKRYYFLFMHYQLAIWCLVLYKSWLMSSHRNPESWASLPRDRGETKAQRGEGREPTSQRRPFPAQPGSEPPPHGAAPTRAQRAVTFSLIWNPCAPAAWSPPTPVHTAGERLPFSNRCIHETQHAAGIL